jgi:protein TonB
VTTPFTLVEPPAPPPPVEAAPQPPVERPPPPPPPVLKVVHALAPPEPAPPTPEAPPVVEVEAPQPKATGRVRVVGLSLSSTVSNGGAAYAVGNTRLGQTSTEAGDPLAAAPLAAEARAPRRTSAPEPDYPAELRAQNLEGDVGLEVQLDERGAITALQVVTPSAFEAFDRAAVEAARRATYEPASVNGLAQPYALRFTVRFRLRKGAP